MKKNLLTFGMVLAIMSLFASFSSAQDSSGTSAPIPMKIKAPFTLSAVSDIGGPKRTITQFADPAFQGILKHLHEGDVAFANQEGPTLPIVSEFKAMGINMISQANNHTIQNGIPSMLSTSADFDKAGIVHAGSGRDLFDARAPRFLFTSKGVVGLEAIFAIDENQFPQASQLSGATYPFGDHAGKPGANGLHLTTYYVVTPSQLQALREIRDSTYAPGNPPASAATNWLPTLFGYGKLGQDSVELFGKFYKSGPHPGTLSYEMNPDDLNEILNSIRTGKQYADFMIVTIHAHQYSVPWQSKTLDPDLRESGVDSGVPDYLIQLAHLAIDNGADAFIAGGIHAMRGIEIYKGKPIFYGMSNFVSMGISETVLDVKPTDRSFEGLTGVVTTTDAPIVSRAPDGGLGTHSWGALPRNLEAQLGVCRYEGGRLVEVRVYPADLGIEKSRPISLLGVPMTPTPAIAHQILDEIQELSAPFGTKISIEDNVGVIHVSPDSGGSSN